MYGEQIQRVKIMTLRCLKLGIDGRHLLLTYVCKRIVNILFSFRDAKTINIKIVSWRQR